MSTPLAVSPPSLSEPLTSAEALGSFLRGLVGATLTIILRDHPQRRSFQVLGVDLDGEAVRLQVLDLDRGEEETIDGRAIVRLRVTSWTARRRP